MLAQLLQLLQNLYICTFFFTHGQRNQEVVTQIVKRQDLSLVLFSNQPTIQSQFPQIKTATQASEEAMT